MQLKRENGGHIMKYGVTALDRALLDNKLVDEYDLWITPTCVDRGKRAFADIEADKLDLEMLRTHRFTNGVMALTYRPRKSMSRKSGHRFCEKGHAQTKS